MYFTQKGSGTGYKFPYFPKYSSLLKYDTTAQQISFPYRVFGTAHQIRYILDFQRFDTTI